MGDEPGEGRARPVGTWARSFREAGGILPGTFRDPSGKLAGRFGDVGAAEAPSDRAGGPGEGGPAGTLAVGKPPLRDGSAWISRRARPVGDAARILPGSFREASGKLAGRFGDDSRTVRGRWGGGSAVRPRRRAGRGGRAGTSAVGKPPLRCGSASISRRARGGGPWPPARVAAIRGRGDAVPLNEFRVNRCWGVHLNPARPRPAPSQGPSAQAPGPNPSGLTSDCTETHGLPGRRIDAPAGLSGLSRRNWRVRPTSPLFQTLPLSARPVGGQPGHRPGLPDKNHRTLG
jgi:hypothetical protein